MTRVGLQLYSIKEAAEKDFLGTIRRAAALGYEGVQFAGFFNHPAEEVRKTMDESGIEAAGAHVQITDLKDRLEETLAYHETIGNRLLICPFLPEELRSSREDYIAIAEQLDEIGKKVRAAGFTLAYHNHNFEFEKYDGKTGFAYLYEQTAEENMKMELDCYWAKYAGHDPLQIIQQYAGRVVSLHIKDVTEKEGKTVSTEIGTGVLDLDGIIEAGVRNKVDWFIVEQEDFEQDPFLSVEQNYTALKAIIEQVG